MIVEKKKYIIELTENTHWIQWIMESTKDHHPYMDYKQVEDLTPYTGPDLEQVNAEKDKIYDEARARGYDEGRARGYQEGLFDAWECARKIAINEASGGLSLVELDKIFSCDDLAEVFGFTASEAIEKIKAYEQESITAEDVMRQYLDTFCKERGCGSCPLNTPDFTCGRGYHFLTTEPVSDEEVRRAYAKVCKRRERGKHDGKSK